MFRVTLLILLSAANCACAQAPASADIPEQQAEKVVRPSENLLGEWVPYSKAYLNFGELVIEPDVLSWDSCVKVPYRVARAEGQGYLIELLPSSPCKLFIGMKFMVLSLSDDEKLEASICREPAEIRDPLANGHCASWGVLYKKRH